MLWGMARSRCFVWSALFWNRHIHSERARRWFEESSDEQFFYCLCA
jgi:hypothetical protein